MDNFASEDEERHEPGREQLEQEDTFDQDDELDEQFGLEAEQECALNLSLNNHKSRDSERELENSEQNHHHHQHHHDQQANHIHHQQHSHITNNTENNSRSNSNGSASSSSSTTSSTSGWSSAADSLTSRSPEQPAAISSPISASQAISLLQKAARQQYYYQYNNTLNQLTNNPTLLQASPDNNNQTSTPATAANPTNLLTRQQQAHFTSLATNQQYHHLFQAQQQAQLLTNNSPANNRLLFIHHHQNHHTLNHNHHQHELGPVHKADSDDLDRIRNFIEQFKARRGALGLTQKQAAQCFRAYTNDRYAFSDNFVGHFEGFQFRPQTAMTIADSLAEWLEFAENETRQGRQLSFVPGKVKETRKRKYEVIRIRDSAKRILVEAFEKNKSPSTSELEQLSRKTNIPSRNIEIFFKNRRTSRQYHQ